MNQCCDLALFRCAHYAIDGIGTALRDLAAGTVPTIRVPGFVSAADAERLTTSFLRCPEVEERQDGVWGKSGAYLLKMAGDSVERLNDEVSAAPLTSPTARNRPAVRHGSPVTTARMSAGLPGTGLLDAHDDIGQLRDPQQLGFEPHQVADNGVLAVNLHTSSPAEGGRLRLWNAMSDTATREPLGIAHSGYPYPGSCLQGHDFIDIQPRAGDLVLINGAIPHTMTLYQAAEPRVAINYFFGRLGESVIRWV